MSVLIKDFDMPTCCEECLLGVWLTNFSGEDFFRCVAMYKTIDEDEEKRHEMCPLVEVPTPHGELIDRNAIIETYNLDKATKYGNKDTEQQTFSYSTMMMYEFADVIDDAPTVIEAEE